MKNRYLAGSDSWTVTVPAPVGGVVSGGFYAIGLLRGVAGHDAAAGEDFTLHCDGVFWLPKATTASTALAVGAGVQWATDKAAAVASAQKIGVVVKAAVDADARVLVKLTPDA